MLIYSVFLFVFEKHICSAVHYKHICDITHGQRLNDQEWSQLFLIVAVFLLVLCTESWRTRRPSTKSGKRLTTMSPTASKSCCTGRTVSPRFPHFLTLSQRTSCLLSLILRELYMTFHPHTWGCSHFHFRTVYWLLSLTNHWIFLSQEHQSIVKRWCVSFEVLPSPTNN